MATQIALLFLLPNLALAEPSVKIPCPPAEQLKAQIHSCQDNGLAVEQAKTCAGSTLFQWAQAASELKAKSTADGLKTSSAQNQELKASGQDLEQANLRIQALLHLTKDCKKRIKGYAAVLTKDPIAKKGGACFREASKALKSIAKQLREHTRQGKLARGEIKKLRDASKSRQAGLGLADGSKPKTHRLHHTHSEGAPSLSASSGEDSNVASTITGTVEAFKREANLESADAQIPTPVAGAADPNAFLKDFFQP